VTPYRTVDLNSYLYNMKQDFCAGHKKFLAIGKREGAMFGKKGRLEGTEKKQLQMICGINDEGFFMD